MTMNLMQRIDRAIESLADEPAITLTQAVDAVLADGLPTNLRREDLRLAVKLRFDGEPLLDGIAGTMQRACVRAQDARLPLPGLDDLLRIVEQAHPAATEDEVEQAFAAFSEHQRAQAARFATRAGMLRVELIRRRATK